MALTEVEGIACIFATRGASNALLSSSNGSEGSITARKKIVWIQCNFYFNLPSISIEEDLNSGATRQAN